MSPERQAQINHFYTVLDHWLRLKDAVMAVDIGKKERARLKVWAALRTKLVEEARSKED